jgi:hypothetical protein
VLLYARDLRDLGPSELTRYAFKALTTWGDKDDFRHFLPRIFELISVDGGSWTLPQTVFGKLAYGRWGTWPSEERQTITTFFEALWSNVLDHFPHPFSAEGCLCCIAQATDDMTHYLSRWHIAESLTHAKHFGSLVEDGLLYWSHNQGKTLEGTFWESRPAAARQVIDWLYNPTRASELRRASSQLASHEEDAALLSKAAHDLLYSSATHVEGR